MTKLSVMVGCLSISLIDQNGLFSFKKEKNQSINFPIAMPREKFCIPPDLTFFFNKRFLV